MPYWFDGNNLIGQSAAQARQDAGLRKAFLLTLSGYATAAGVRFLVYFDGDDPDGHRPPKAVQVRYSAPRSTDDTILLRLQELRAPAEIIVVTNDQSLRRQCREAGAQGIDWAEFLRRMNARPKQRRRSKDSEEEPVDIDKWAEYFGLKKNSLQ